MFSFLCFAASSCPCPVQQSLVEIQKAEALLQPSRFLPLFQLLPPLLNLPSGSYTPYPYNEATYWTAADLWWRQRPTGFISQFTRNSTARLLNYTFPLCPPLPANRTLNLFRSRPGSSFAPRLVSTTASHATFSWPLPNSNGFPLDNSNFEFEINGAVQTVARPFIFQPTVAANQVRVRARNNLGWGPWSPLANFTFCLGGLSLNCDVSSQTNSPSSSSHPCPGSGGPCNVTGSGQSLQQPSQPNPKRRKGGQGEQETEGYRTKQESPQQQN